MTLIPSMVPYEASRFRMDLAEEMPDEGYLTNNAAQGGVFWQPNSSKLFAIEGSSGAQGAVYKYSVYSSGTTPGAGGTITLDYNRTYTGVCFNHNGTKLFAQYTSNVDTYNLSQAYGGTATFVATDYLGAVGNAVDLRFNADGTIVYYSGSGGLRQKPLSVAYDLSTIGSQTTLQAGFTFFDIARGGTRLLNSQGDTTTEWGGETPYDFKNFTETGNSITLSGAGSTKGRYRPNGSDLQIFIGKNVHTYSTSL